MDVEINWYYLSQAVNLFKARGYEYVEAPWIVPTEVLKVTCPEEHWIVQSNIGGLVGSAEQSFIHLENIKSLKTGKFVACTPCFRNEERVDNLRQKTFMKVELYSNKDVSSIALEHLVNDMLAFYRTFLSIDEWSTLDRVSFPDGSVDIELAGIEIGSYGTRERDGRCWLYGTALAEPRFSSALKILRQ
jgi:hypothetical protein